MTTGRLLLSALVCALACLTRYAGVFLFAAGILLILLNSDMLKRRRIVHAVIFGSLSVSFFVINVLRNYLVTGLPMGQRPKNDSTVIQVLENFGGCSATGF
jgi:4-amino-4-deoxy-L-arabinose transferase-like glycosyltransferase